MANSFAKRRPLVLVTGAAVIALVAVWLVFGSSARSSAILTVKVGRNPAALAEGPDGEVWVGHSVGCCRSGSLTAIDPDTGEILRTLHTEEPIGSVAALGGEVWGGTGAERTMAQVGEDEHLTNIRFPGTFGDPIKIEAGEGSPVGWHDPTWRIRLG